MRKLRIVEICLLLIISIPAFWSLFHTGYFSMHDYQHIARLYLLDKGIHQGYLYPRWVDTLGFSFGYPLFNFYPPLIYYIAEIFHLLGLSFILSIKAMIMIGFFVSAVGMFYFAKRRAGSLGAFLAATLYTYFFYHAVLVYVRGAFAEFFTLAILPFVFLTFENLWKKPTLKNSVFFAISFALLILTHPLIAFPSILFLSAFTAFFLWKREYRNFTTMKNGIVGAVLALGLSAFFWLPAMIERKFTLLDKVQPTELSYYQLHFVCPQQFLYSMWGYGGSIEGCFDGMTFQLGKLHLILFLLAFLGATTYLIRQKKHDSNSSFYFLYFVLALFSIFMTTELSNIVWEKIAYLQYLEFPWRFLSFTAFFLSISASFAVYFFNKIFSAIRWRNVILVITMGMIVATVGYYQKYFHPQEYIYKSDTELTGFDEISWRVSRSSFDFLPAEIQTKKSNIDTTIPTITQSDLRQESYGLYKGNGTVEVIKNKMAEKEFTINSTNTNVLMELWLYTFNFPGWTASLDGNPIVIKDDNPFRLISVTVPLGYHNLRVEFKNSPVRNIGNTLSVLSVICAILLLWGRGKFKQIERGLSAWFDKPLDELKR